MDEGARPSSTGIERGEISTGSMVALGETPSSAEARPVVRLLEAHFIPALLADEVEGVLIPWQQAPRNGNVRVFVPSSMLRSAQAVLAKHAVKVGARRARSPSDGHREARHASPPALPRPPSTPTPLSKNDPRMSYSPRFRTLLLAGSVMIASVGLALISWALWLPR